MSTHLGWHEIAIRLALTVAAGAVIGINRGEHGRAAGLRTTILVSLAAAVSMIQVNLLLTLSGKAPDSFVMLDLMRLPLGILSGMGFIGAGAILRRGNMVTGVTTAATLWFVTVMGLCFGGGQLGLGLAAFCIALVVLSSFKWGENLVKQDRAGTLFLTTSTDGPTEQEIRDKLIAARFRILTCTTTFTPSKLRRLKCRVEWRARRNETQTPEAVRRLADIQGVARVHWTA